MDISSQITISVKPEYIKSRIKTGAFQPGSILTLKVVELKGDRALVDFGNFRATADIKIPVSLGEEVAVRVLETGKQLKLVVLDPEPKNPLPAEESRHPPQTQSHANLGQIQHDVGRLLNQLAGTADNKKIPLSIFNVLANLNAYFEPFELKDIISELLPRLKSYLENSGIFFEKSLEQAINRSSEGKDGGIVRNPAELAEVKAIFRRDLKPNLMALQQFINQSNRLHKIFGSRTLAAMKEAIDTLLTDIRQQQGRAVSSMDSTEPFQMFGFTLPLKEEEQTARLKVFYEKKQKAGSKREFQVSLMLSMDRLGDIRTDLILSGGGLQVTFYVTEPSAKIKIQENIAEMDDVLGDLFDSVKLTVNLSPKRVKDFDRSDAHTTGNQKVDVRI